MTFLTTIDGHLLKEMVINGAGMLEKHKAAIDALNVFPVPDGDTGNKASISLFIIPQSRVQCKASIPIAAEITALTPY